MPRPKPPAPLKPRQVRLSDAQWAVFNEMGGAKLLRSQLDKSTAMIRFEKRERDAMIMADLKKMTTQQVAEKYELHHSTICRIAHERKRT